MRKSAFALVILLAAAFGLAPAQQGPSRDSAETVAKPRTKAGEAQPAEQPKIPSKFGKKEGEQTGIEPTFRSEVTAVSVDVSVLDKNSRPIPNIPKGNFRILEDNVPQTVSKVEMGTEAPMTVCLVIEFSNRFQQYWGQGWYETLMAAYGFVETLKPEDYVAVVAYDIRPEMLSDFSTNRQDTMQALQRLRIAAFSESNLYDALTDTADRMSEIEGRKAIVLISSGVDTFSKLTFDNTRKILQRANVPIYGIGILQALREILDARGYMGPEMRLDFLQADNQMRTFARETGGQAFFPRFLGEFPGIFRAISEALRTSYTLTYKPSNTARDGKFRKIKVELVNPATNEPLKVTDEKGKPVKYTILAKAGYTAPREVE
ncbi:MAG TPA: VWA domain-containing protein [Bryobacteraceae bacterium]|nr:VWA domain-containing protein [Bryobacteraceae bacterium]